MVARGVSKSCHSPDGPDFGEGRPVWGAVPECNTGNPTITGNGTRTDAPSFSFRAHSCGDLELIVVGHLRDVGDPGEAFIDVGYVLRENDQDVRA